MDIIVLPNGLGESLVKELRTSVSAEALTYCLRAIGVLERNETLSSYHDIQPWKRGGAETFYAVSEVATNEAVRKFVAKALFSFARSPLDQLTDWLTRRELLASSSIPTPKLFSASKGTIYEEFIDAPLPPRNYLTNELLTQLGQIASKLDHLGFHPTAFLNDVRVKNNLIYYIDFGSDLGSPKHVHNSYALEYLKKQLPDKQFQIVQQAY